MFANIRANEYARIMSAYPGAKRKVGECTKRELKERFELRKSSNYIVIMLLKGPLFYLHFV